MKATFEKQLFNENVVKEAGYVNSLIEQLKECGFSVFIRNSGSKKIIMWSTKTHWASASLIESSENDLKRICQRLKETIYNAQKNRLSNN